MVEEDEFVVLSGIFGAKVTISEVYTQIYLPFIELLLSKMSEKVLSNLTTHQQQFQSLQQTSDILSLDEKRRREGKSNRSHGSKRKDELDQRFVPLKNCQDCLFFKVFGGRHDYLELFSSCRQCVCVCGVRVFMVCLCLSNCTTLIFLECSKKFSFLAAEKRGEAYFLVRIVIFPNAYRLLSDTLNGLSDWN